MEALSLALLLPEQQTALAFMLLTMPIFLISYSFSKGCATLLFTIHYHRLLSSAAVLLWGITLGCSIVAYTDHIFVFTVISLPAPMYGRTFMTFLSPVIGLISL